MPDLTDLPDTDPISPDDFVYVVFTPGQQRVIQYVGAERQSAKDAAGIRDNRQSSDDSHSVHVIGLAAEAALAKALGTQPDLRVGIRGNQGVSLEAHGATFNTTWVSNPQYTLKTFVDDVPPVDALVLLEGDMPTLRIVGWLPREEFIERKRRMHLSGLGTRWAVPRRRLRPFRQLLAALDVEMPPVVRDKHETVWRERHGADDAEPSLFTNAA